MSERMSQSHPAEQSRNEQSPEKDFSQMDYAEAQREMKKLMTDPGTSPELLTHLGDVFVAKAKAEGKSEKFIASFEAALTKRTGIEKTTSADVSPTAPETSLTEEEHANLQELFKKTIEDGFSTIKHQYEQNISHFEVSDLEAIQRASDEEAAYIQSASLEDLKTSMATEFNLPQQDVHKLSNADLEKMRSTLVKAAKWKIQLAFQVARERGEHLPASI